MCKKIRDEIIKSIVNNLGISTQEAEILCKNDKVITKYLKAIEKPPDIKKDLTNTEATVSKSETKDPKTTFQLDGKPVNQETLFYNWFIKIEDNDNASKIKKYLDGDTTRRTNLTGYLTRTKITDVEVFVKLYNILCPETNLVFNGFRKKSKSKGGV